MPKRKIAFEIVINLFETANYFCPHVFRRLSRNLGTSYHKSCGCNVRKPNHFLRDLDQNIPRSTSERAAFMQSQRKAFNSIELCESLSATNVPRCNHPFSSNTGPGIHSIWEQQARPAMNTTYACLYTKLEITHQSGNLGEKRGNIHAVLAPFICRKPCINGRSAENVVVV